MCSVLDSHDNNMVIRHPMCMHYLVGMAHIRLQRTWMMEGMRETKIEKTVVGKRGEVDDRSMG